MLTLLLAVFITLSTGLYIGGDPGGTQLTSTDARADTVTVLTYLFLNNNYSVSTNTEITITQVNFVTQNGGEVTPFLAVYTSGSETSGSSFTLILEGDPITAQANSVVNSLFTVNAVPSPTITLQAGQTLVAGAYQTQSIIKFGAGLGTTFNTLIWNGDVVPAILGTFPATPNYIFDFQEYRFNIEIIPEATTLIGSQLVLPSVSLSERADTVTVLTYLFLEYTYTAPNSNILVTFTNVNLVTQNAGLLTPIVALYTGTVPTSGTSYTLLVKGDPIQVPANSLHSAPLTVGGKPFSVILSAGQTIVAGAFQPTNIIRFASDSTVAHNTLIWNGDVIPTGPSNLFPTPYGWYFTSQYYHYNIAFETSSIVLNSPLSFFGSDVSGSALSLSTSRADTVTVLTYIFIQNLLHITSNSKVTIVEVNLVSQNAGIVTPFIALYNGGTATLGASYSLLLQGDPIEVPASSLVNAKFTVGGVNPVLFLSSGETLVAGAFQSSNIIQFATSPSANTLIWEGNVIPTATNVFPDPYGWYFTTLTYRYNLGVSVEDAISTLVEGVGSDSMSVQDKSETSNLSFGVGPIVGILLAVIGLVLATNLVTFFAVRYSNRRSTDDVAYLRN